ncbi:D-arabinono-1,4-lactone oxidase [Brachybacterium huguangmaarense]
MSIRTARASAPDMPRAPRSNWSGSAVFPHREVVAPTSETEIVEALRATRDRGHSVRVVGGGHSFTPLVATTGTLMTLDGYQGVVRADAATGLVTLRGGTRLWTIGELLAPHGLALESMGDIDRQSIAGAIQTGTHGTGHAMTGFAGTVRGVRVALADGSVVDASPEKDRDLFEAARLGLGTLGVICEVTLQCVPRYALSMVEATVPLEPTAAGFVETSAQADHQEFFWFPGTKVATLRTSTRLPDGTPTSRPSRAAEILSSEVLGNGAFELLCRAAQVVPPLSGPVAEVAARVFAGSPVTDDSPRVYVAPRRVRFHESEWAVPAERFEEAFAALRRMMADSRVRVTFPLEIRRIAPDDVWMSTASGRDSVYIAAHRYHREDAVPYLRRVQATLAPFAARPHWGKRHWLGADELRARYPRFDDFLAVRAQADPDGLFLTPYLRGMLGL